MTVKEITDWVDNLEEIEDKDKALLRNYILSKKKATNHPDSEDELLDCIAELTDMLSICVDNLNSGKFESSAEKKPSLDRSFQIGNMHFVVETEALQ